MDSDPSSTRLRYQQYRWTEHSILNRILEGLGYDYLLATRKWPSFKERKRRT